MPNKKFSRRDFLATTAASTVALAMPHVRGAYAAGKLSLGLWDHWVPGANNATTALINEWAEKEKVDVSVDYIPSQGNKLLSPLPPRRRRGRATTFPLCRAGSRRIMRAISSRSTTSWRS